MKLTTGVLDTDEYLRAVLQLAVLLAQKGTTTLLVSYGFGCDCPHDELYKEVAMRPEDLQGFITQGVAVDYYRVGKDNLHINVPSSGLEVFLYHEGEVQCFSEDTTLLRERESLWNESGFRASVGL